MKLGAIILIGLIVLSIAVFLIYGDKEKDAKTFINKENNQTYLGCDGTDRLQPSSRNASHLICYVESPPGHMWITSPQLFLIFFIIIVCGAYTFFGWREFKSSRIFPLENLYQDGYSPICKHSTIFRQKGFLRVRGGYDAYIDEEKNDFYISNEDMAEQVGKHIVFWGSLKKISPQMLYLYLGKDAQLLKEILDNQNIQIIKDKVTYTPKGLNIYIPVPVPYRKIKPFLTIKGNYSINADRFDLILRTLFKMRRNIKHSYPHLASANKTVLEDAKKIAQGTAVIAGEFKKTRGTDLVDERRPQQPQQQQDMKP